MGKKRGGRGEVCWKVEEKINHHSRKTLELEMEMAYWNVKSG